jgi:hypothetical protein
VEVAVSNQAGNFPAEPGRHQALPIHLAHEGVSWPLSQDEQDSQDKQDFSDLFILPIW